MVHRRRELLQIVVIVVGILVVTILLKESNQLNNGKDYYHQEWFLETEKSDPAHKATITTAPTFSSSPLSKNNINITNMMIIQQRKQDQINCRLNLQRWLNPKIDGWLEQDVPLLDWAMTMNDGTMVVMFRMKHVRLKEQYMSSTTWYCDHGESQNNETTTEAIRNEFQQFVHLVHCNRPATAVWPQPVFDKATNRTTPLVKYDLTRLLECSDLERHDPSVVVVVNDDDDSGKWSNLTSTTPKIGACLRFRGNRDLVNPWIAYHRLLGMQHFWIFINEPLENLTGLIRNEEWPDVTYIPYDYVWGDHNNHSKFRAPYAGKDFWQVPAQMQCLYQAKRYGLKWITTTDVDEYIWINNSSLRNNNNTKNNPLLEILSRFENDNDDEHPIAGLEFNNIPFGRYKEIEPEPYEYVMDYTYRSINHKWEHYKVLYHVPRATNIGIHWAYDGGKTVKIPEEELHSRHYKNPHNGVFKGRKTEKVQDTALRDEYKGRVVNELRRVKGAGGGNDTTN